MIPSIAPIRFLVVYFGGAFFGSVLVSNVVKYTAHSFFTPPSRGTRKTLSSFLRGRRLEPPS